MKESIAAEGRGRLDLQRPQGAAWRERSGRLFCEFERPAAAMLRRAFRGGFSAEEIEDIYATAWTSTLRALAHRHQSLSDDEVRSYVFAAVANQAGKELRRRRRKPTAPLELVAAVPDHATEDPHEQAAEAERSRVTRDLLASLPPRRRAVILLRYGWGLEPRQVCALIKGLSHRAYRKEITRGVEELTEKMRTVARGEWCTTREPVLRAFVAGVANADQERQARSHLAHCRECSAFVARLRGHLHDLGGAVVVPGVLDGIDDQISLGERVGALADHAHEMVVGFTSRVRGVDELGAQAAAAGGARGAGAAGAGLAAKIAGLGATGKLAAACIGGGVAATACIAAGVGPINLRGDQPARPSADRPAAERVRGVEASAAPKPELMPSQIGHQSAPAPEASPSPVAPSPEDDVADAAPAPAPEPVEPSAPVAATTPPAQREFAAPAAAAPLAPAPAPAASGGSSDGGSSGSVVRQEFGP